MAFFKGFFDTAKEKLKSLGGSFKRKKAKPSDKSEDASAESNAESGAESSTESSMEPEVPEVEEKEPGSEAEEGKEADEWGMFGGGDSSAADEGSSDGFFFGEDSAGEPSPELGGEDEEQESAGDINEAEVVPLEDIAEKTDLFKTISVKLEEVPVKTYLAILALFIVFLAVVTVVFNKSLSYYRALRVQKQYRGEIIVDNNITTASNDLNFIYVNAEMSINGETLMLKRMVLDNLSAVFYFDGGFDFERYDISLSDNFGRIYTLDLSYLLGEKPVFSGETVRFAPLGLGTRSFAVTVTELESGVSSDLLFAFTTPHQIKPQKNLNTPQYLHGANGAVLGSLNYAEFSTTASTVFFTLNKTPNGMPIDFLDKPNTLPISLEAGLKGINTLRSEPLLFLLPDRGEFVGRMDFEPLKNLGGNAKVSFNNLCERYDIEVRLSAIDLLFNNDSDKMAVIDLGDYEIVLERILKYNDKFKLVYHCRDLRVEGDENSDRYFNRVEAQIECVLEIKMVGGAEVRLEGVTQSKQIGSDMDFSYADSEYYNAISQGRFSGFELVVSAAKIGLGSITITIDMDALIYNPSVVKTMLSAWFAGENEDKDGYTAEVVAYERIGSTTRAILAETWRDPSRNPLIIRETAGYVDANIVRLDINRIFSYD